MSGSHKQPEPGFYFIHHPSEKEPILVRGYRSTNNGSVFGFGFNVHDGGGFLPLTDMTGEETIIPATVDSPKKVFEITELDAMQILEILIYEFERKEKGKEESIEHYENRESNSRSLISIFADIVTMSNKSKEGETVTVKVVFGG